MIIETNKNGGPRESKKNKKQLNMLLYDLAIWVEEQKVFLLAASHRGLMQSKDLQVMQCRSAGNAYK